MLALLTSHIVNARKCKADDDASNSTIRDSLNTKSSRATKRAKRLGQRKPLPRLEAFFTTDLSLSLEAILELYRDRWAVEITIRDSYGFDGLGQVRQLNDTVSRRKN